MPFTAEKRRHIAHAFVTESYKRPNVTADLDVDDINAAIDAGEVHVAALKTAFLASLPPRFRAVATPAQARRLFRLIAGEV